MPEPSHRQPSQDHPQAFAIGIHDGIPARPTKASWARGCCSGRTGVTSRRSCIRPWRRSAGVIWVGGARGAGGRATAPMRGSRRAASGPDRLLRLCYRHPNVLPECALDVMAGVAYLKCRAQSVVLVGHSFGGAVVMTAGALHARGGRRGLSAADLWRDPGREAGPASAAGGARQSRHQAPLLVRGADVPLGAGAETAGPVRGRRAPPGRMRRRTGSAVHAWIPATLRAAACMGSVVRSIACTVEPVDWPTKRISLDGFGGGRVASIAPEEFVPYMSAAFDGMLAVAEELGDARLNQRPQHMPNTSTPLRF